MKKSKVTISEKLQTKEFKENAQTEVVHTVNA